jgi:electron transport complex protein RnfB
VNGLAARINNALPQTQCTRCGYPDCAGYAQAVATEEAGINQCPPGGSQGIERLALITGRPLLPLDPQFGTEGPRAMAVIDEAWCIGCTLCLDACPTDAIVGINKRMHTVIEAHCTGCELCIPACPVDCISLEVETPGQSGWQAWSAEQADHARSRYELHGKHRDTDTPDVRLVEQSAEAQDAQAPQDAGARKRSIVEAALARARAASQQRPPPTKP